MCARHDRNPWFCIVVICVFGVVAVGGTQPTENRADEPFGAPQTARSRAAEAQSRSQTNTSGGSNAPAVIGFTQSQFVPGQYPGPYSYGFPRPLTGRDLNQLQQSPHVRQPNFGISGYTPGPLFVPNPIHVPGQIYAPGQFYAPGSVYGRGSIDAWRSAQLRHPGYPFYRGVWPGVFWYPMGPGAGIAVPPPAFSTVTDLLTSAGVAGPETPDEVPWVYGSPEPPATSSRLPFGLTRAQAGTLVSPYQIGEIVDAKVPVRTDVVVQQADKIAPGAARRIVAVRNPDAQSTSGVTSVRNHVVYVEVQVPPQPIRKLTISPDRSLVQLNYGNHWAEINTANETIVVTYGP